MLDNSKNSEQDEIRRLNEVVKELEEALASRIQKLFDMEESKMRLRIRLREMEGNKNKVEREKVKVEEERDKFEEKSMKLAEEKKKFEAKLQSLVECPVCLTLPREGPVPCCAKGHFVCSPCLGKLRAKNKLEQG